MTDKVPCQPLQLEELPKEDEERLEKLFCNLDKDGDGRIDIHDLSVALKELAPHINQKYAEKFLTDSKIGAGGFTLSEFIYYIKEHEKNLRLQFSHLDKNKDGKVDLEELISAFADLGVAINESEATNLLKRMDQDGSLTISYDEWRDYLILAPATDIHSLIHFWRHSTFTITHLSIPVLDHIKCNIMLEKNNHCLRNRSCLWCYSVNTRNKDRLAWLVMLVDSTKSPTPKVSVPIRYCNKVPVVIQNLAPDKFKAVIKQKLCSKGYYKISDFFDDKSPWELLHSYKLL